MIELNWLIAENNKLWHEVMNRLSVCNPVQEPDIFRFIDILNKERSKLLGGNRWQRNYGLRERFPNQGV